MRDSTTIENIDDTEDLITDEADVPGDVVEIQSPDKNVIIDDNSTEPKTQDPAFISIADMVAELPENYPDANQILRTDIFPKIVDLDGGLQDYYIDLIKKKLSVGKQTIKEALKSYREMEFVDSTEVTGDETQEDEEIDPEIIEKAEQLSLDPEIFKKRINAVNGLGIINEQRNIGVISMTIDSRLNPMGATGSNVLAAKNTGIQGSGKSATLMATLELYSKNCYHYINGGSPKSIYNMRKDALKNKTLVLGEAFSFQGNNSNDSEFTHIIRCLLSEGFVKYQYTSYDSAGNKITVSQTVYGPTPLITTSIYDKLEQQLDDRMFSIHPNTSSKQTSDVILIEAEQASGIFNKIDEQEIQVWRYLHDSLEVSEVIIPFAKDIFSFLVNGGGDLPTPARRAFKRMIISIKTIGLLHQKQRDRDGMGRVIAEMQDYALAYQLVDESFRESLEDRKYMDRRIRIVDARGPIAPKDIAKIEGVSGAAITSWSKNWLRNGALIWCDDQGVAIKKKDLEKMKCSGKAHLKTNGINRLPTPYEISGGNNMWDVGGELYELYNLEFDSGEDVLSEGYADEVNLNTIDDSEELDNSENMDDFESGVKALDKKVHKEIREKIGPDDPETLELDLEFDEFLIPSISF
jgi:DNA primase